MCGILGAVGVGALEAGQVEGALARLRHRGPDDESVYRDGEATLAMRRLAIIDPAGGQQPVFDERRRIAVVGNGEIFNFVELREELRGRGHEFSGGSDIEVVPHLYEEKGIDLARDLRGMFAIALWDGREESLFLVRDRFGQKPLFFVRWKEGLLFASELDALVTLLRGLRGEPRIRPQAVYDYLSLAVVPQPSTIYEGIEALPPASILRFRRGEVRVETYWSPPVPGSGSETAVDLDAVRAAIADAVRIRLRSDVPLGVFLSGGLDSSIVAWEASRVLGESLRTYTVAVGDEDLDESGVASRTAASLGVQHQVLRLELEPRELVEKVVRTFGQPFADPSALPSLAVAQAASRHVRVVLNGDGGDEVFGGYRRYVAARLLGALPTRLPRFVGRLGKAAAVASGRRGSLGFLARFLRGAVLPPEERYLIWTTDMLFESDKRGIWKGPEVRSTEEWVASQLAGEGPLSQLLTGDRMINLLSDLLVKMDMATMACSVEARSPFLDHLLAERMATLDPKVLVRLRPTKWILREAYASVLPREVLAARKRGFEIPLAHWLRSELREMVLDTLGGSPKLGNWISKDVIEGVVHGRRFEERNWGYILYSMLTLELWLRENG